HGTRSILELNQDKQLISPTEERTLVMLSRTLALRGLPFTYKLISKAAAAIVATHVNLPVSQIHIGKNWAERFLHCYANTLRPYWSSGLEAQ
ncbi:hypothetical protein C8Q75DRAFT_727677, partial [Abortiporus biennis]